MIKILVAIANVVFFGLCAAAEVPQIKFYGVTSYDCNTASGVVISYDSSGGREPRVISKWRGAQKLLWNDGGRYLVDVNVSQINFTGHRPSAGPPYDPWETDYSVRISGMLQVGTNEIQNATLYKSVAFGPFVYADRISCKVSIASIF